ncbi:MAG: hypothetical protein QOE81_1854, partial [Verrucomicrobiota bacterium]
AYRRMAGDFPANRNGESDCAQELVSFLVFVRIGKFYQSQSDRSPPWFSQHFFVNPRSVEPNESLVSAEFLLQWHADCSTISLRKLK